ncbi:MAG: acetate kinase [Gallionella sp.]|nr:acetate kinase [Gallionella sp.]
MPSILTINSGSSSIKASLFSADGSRRDFRYGHLRDHVPAFDQLIRDLAGNTPDIVGHRFVHGGDITDAARVVDDAELSRLKNLVQLAPLHLPGNLMGLELCRARFGVPQLACFDTAFHATMPELAKRLPIPASYGLRRYGFHGLNYAHIASVLPGLLGAAASGNIVVAHLGSGASLCMLRELRSQDTTMGYTPAGGITMGTRSGDLDPGVMLELALQHDPATLRDIVFHRMGLLALSDGESSEMSDLLDSASQPARFAVEYFCQQVSGAIGSLAAKAGGLDAIVFTGGIGENSAEIRQRICAKLAFIGFFLDLSANKLCATRISLPDSKPLLVIKADEEDMMRKLCVTQAENR